MSHACYPETHGASHFAGLGPRLVRLGWMAVGQCVLLLLAAHISLSREGFLTGSDLAFWLTVAALLGARYLDITWLHGQTVTGERATLGHWRDFAAVTVLFSLGLWLLAHGLALLAASA